MVRCMEIRTLFPLNLRQFALTDFKKSHIGKKNKEKDKANGVGPIKIDSLFWILWSLESNQAKNEMGKNHFRSDIFLVLLEIAF